MKIEAANRLRASNDAELLKEVDQIIENYQMVINRVPSLKALKIVQSALQKEIRELKSKPSYLKEVPEQLRDLIKRLQSSKVVPNGKNVDVETAAKFNRHMIETVKKARNYWADEPQSCLLLFSDIVDWLLLVAAISEGSKDEVVTYRKGDTVWREEIPSDIWHYAKEGVKE